MNLNEYLSSFGHKRKDGTMTFRQIEVCGNTLQDCDHIITVDVGSGTYVPLDIGYDPDPPIRIRTLAKDGSFPIIFEGDEPRVKEISVDRSNGKIDVYFLSQKMLSYDATVQSAVVSYLDLRPVGLNIHGDEKGLLVGDTLLKGVHFIDIGSAIHIGD